MTDAENRIDIKLENLEASVKRIEDLILREISELKTEQIADLRKDNERLADDQRRLWEAVRSLETDRNVAHGGGRVLAGLVTGAISIVSSSAAAVFITKFMK